MLKSHFSPRVKVKPRYRRDLLSRGQAWFAFCFLLNEVGDLSFSGHYFILTPLCAVKNVKNLSQKKKVTGKKVFVAITRGHKNVPSRSGTGGKFVVSAFSCRVPVP